MDPDTQSGTNVERDLEASGLRPGREDPPKRVWLGLDC